MRKIPPLWAIALFIIISQAASVRAQDVSKDSRLDEVKPAQEKAAAEISAPKEESSVTSHTIRLEGQDIPYRAIASTMLIKNRKGEPSALIYSTAYIRSDLKDFSQRPIAFLYNGGPGMASIWLLMGAFGPRRVLTPDASPSLPPPYHLTDNASCLLDKADLVFIDPVGTGFSHAVDKARNRDFWGVDEDAKSLEQFISLFVSRNNRWNSPKFLIGESYGTFRSAVLGNYLQSSDGIYLNGIVLISTVLDMNTLEFNHGNDMPYIFYLPSYAAAAWYHKMLKNRPADLNIFLDEARKFSKNEYAQALMKGAKLSATEKEAIAAKISRFTGLSDDYLIKANLRVTLGQFNAELQRSRGLITGRLDSRFSGPARDLLAEHAYNDPEFTAVSGAFTAAFNYYVREELQYGMDKTYRVYNEDAGNQWNWKRGGDRTSFIPNGLNVEDDLVHALITNPHLKVEVENGLFDLATPFLATEYTMDHLDLPVDLRENIHLNYYNSGHMIYLNAEDLARLKSNIASFIDSSTKQ